MNLGFSRHHTLHTSLDKALLGDPGHKAADVIQQRPWSLNPASSPISDSSVENKFINRQFYWRVHTGILPIAMWWCQSISGAKINTASIIHVTDFLRLLWGLLLPSFPTHLSHRTDSPGMSDREGEHRRGRLENVIQSSWGAMRLTAAMKFHFELSVYWWNNEMKVVVQTAGESNDGVCGVFRGMIWLYVPFLRTRTPSRPREMNHFVILLSLPPDLQPLSLLA